MAGTLAILTALGRTVVRDLRSLGSLAGNNFFLFCFLLLQGAGPFVPIVLMLILLVPLAGDPLACAPKERMHSWPLTGRQRLLLRVGSLMLNPAAWITGALLFFTARPWLGLQFAALVLAVQLIMLAWARMRARAPQVSVFRWIPPLPGVLGGLARKNIRELLSVLDPYPGVVLAAGGALYQLLSPGADPEASFAITLLVVLSMSTSAQALLALDGPAGLARYRLWPVRGSLVLFAKGVAFLAVTLLLCLPLDPVTGLAAAPAALAVGNHVSARHPRAQQRWRFTGGSLGVGVIQVILMFSAGTMAHRGNALFVVPGCAALWALSVLWYGRDLES